MTLAFKLNASETPEFLTATDATDTIIVATVKVHRQQVITSSFDDDTRIPKFARVAFKLNASLTVTGTPNF
jgi:anionic cell wall polymer biosynthesis LytR-Cps2A-Psr (LCP) family protein